MSSTIILYQAEHLEKKKNFSLDNIEDYLEDYVDVYLTLTTGQTIKHDINIEVKVPFNGVENPLLSNEYYYNNRLKFNYCSIENSGENPFTIYYYIDKVEYISQKVLRLVLTMDVLNSFKPTTDYQLTDKTLVTREHKDRFTKLSVNANGTFNVRRKIDYINEGINPALFKVTEKQIDVSNYSGSWYLVYENNNAVDPDAYNQVNPVNCFLCADYDLLIQYTNNDGVINLSSLANGVYYTSSYLGETYNTDLQGYMPNDVDYSIEVDGVILRVYNEGTFLQDNSYEVAITKSSNGVKVEYILRTHNILGYHQGILKTMDNVSSIKVLNQTSLKYVTPPSVGVIVEDYVLHSYQVYTMSFTALQSGTLKSIEDVDRTDPKLIKIIKLPYCPCRYGVTTSGDNKVFEIDTSLWSFNSGRLQLRDLNSKFRQFMRRSGDLAIFDVFNTTINPNASTPVVADISNESKLFSSEFYAPKFVYDSFMFVFSFELIDTSLMYNYSSFEFNFIPTTTINSRFLFTFPQYNLKYSTEAYENVLHINRSNEMTLYSNQYINYIKSGYNYDKKNKDLALWNDVANAGIGVASGITQATLGVSAFGSQSIWGATNLSRGVTGVASSITAPIFNTIKRENDFEKNLAQKKNETTSVRGADDIDLLDEYTIGNKAKMCWYSATEIMRNYVYKLFRYYGYSCNEMKKPNLSTRKYYNYIEADVDFDMVDIKIEDNILEEIRARFKEGVTFIHKVNGYWDLSQSLENWEMSLYA